VSYSPVDRTVLKHGAAVFVVSQRQSDGSLSAARVNVGLNGQVPPMWYRGSLTELETEIAKLTKCKLWAEPQAGCETSSTDFSRLALVDSYGAERLIVRECIQVGPQFSEDLREILAHTAVPRGVSLAHNVWRQSVGIADDRPKRGMWHGDTERERAQFRRRIDQLRHARGRNHEVMTPIGGVPKLAPTLRH
jgi:hypothetical protein